MKKRFLSIAMILCIVLTLLPTTALAVGGEGELSISGGIVDTDYSVSGSTVSILSNKAMTVSGTTTTEHIVVGNGMTANLTFNGVSIDVTNTSPVSVEAGGTLNLALTGSNDLRGCWDWPDEWEDKFPAILVPSGATLNISGSGSLNAVAESDSNGTAVPAYCYAIGAPSVNNTNGDIITGGTITISQSTVTVDAYAGIGGVGSDVTISDGARVSLKTTNSIGIGGNSTDGDPYTTEAPNPASVTISGTDTVVRAVMAANSSDSTQSTGIAIGGEDCAVSISGGTVTAVGFDAGIGGDGSNVTVTGGTVTATGTGTVGIGGDNCKVDISGTSTIVKAYGRYIGIGSDYYISNETKGAFDITISGGDVRAWSTVTFGTAAEDWAATYNGNYSSHYWGIGGNLGCDAVGKIAISGGTVDARGYYGGIGGDCGDEYSHSTDEGSLTIDISGGTVNTVALSNPNSNFGIGGDLYSGDSRSITISGNAVVGAWGGLNYNGDEFYGSSIIGGGDCTNSVITIKDNARVIRASVIGGSGATPSSGDNRIGHTGGEINILDNAFVGKFNDYGSLEYDTGADHIGGSMDDYVIQGGDGGKITIDTTGMVGANTIGGGDALYYDADCTGGAGGSITIKNGTLKVTHIGGGNGVSLSTDHKGYGGAGGTIDISGGKLYGLTAQVDIYGSSPTRYYASAGIGGGGGTYQGGSGGTITISGGSIITESSVTVYNSETGDIVSDGSSGDGVGAAGIGGGNGANGGTINISGGTVEVDARLSPDRAAASTALPALIGGGSAGGAGNITISGGYVDLSVDSHNQPAYGDDSTSIGQGKGAIDAGGWIKITGGGLQIPLSTYQTTVARPVPWPVAADGSTILYPVLLSSYVDGVSYYQNCQIVSMSIKKASNGEIYSYSAKDLKPGSYIWLPIEEDTSVWGDESHTLYNITLSIKKDNTTYGFEGTISYFKNENFLRGIAGNNTLTCTGEVIETLQITSDWGNQTKTYDGTDHMPAFTVKNTAGDTLTKDTDYTLKIEYSPNDGYGVKAETDIIKNAGGYYVTATGKTGTAYEGMTATLDVLWINPKHITGIYSGSSFTKQYDGTTDVYDVNGDEVESFTFAINSEDLCTGDLLTDIVADYPRYKTANVGTGIEIDVNSTNYTYTQNGQPSSIYNYSIDQPAITGDITVKVIGETNLNASAVTVTKVYDGTTNCTLTNVAGNVTLVDLAENEIATVSITGVSAFDSKEAGSNRKVTLTIGGLAGANAANYTLAGGATTVEISTASITRADYAYNLTVAQQAQEFTQGGGLSQIILAQTANGVNNEKVTGAVTLWHDEACTANQATNDSVNTLTVGSHNLYVKFVPSSDETNYTTKITTGKVVVLTVVEGDPQDLSFGTSGTVTKTYGEEPFINAATNSTIGGGTITYASSDNAIAEVNASTGEIAIIGAGTTVITATAAKVEGQYRATSISYTLIVGKKAVAVTANNASRKFGEANPVLSIADPSGVLVSGDMEADLGVTLSTTATAQSNVGTYSITGTSTSANYNVTVTAGTLTVGKADAPTVNAINRKLLCSAAHTDVDVTITGLPSNCGTTSFAVGTVTGDTEIIVGNVTGTALGIEFSTAIGTDNQRATIPVNVTMQNYEDATVNVVVTLVDKTPVTITGVTVANKIYDGAAAAYTGTPANEQGYTGTYEYIWSGGSAPRNAGSYTLTVKIPDDNEDFMGEVEIKFTISKKALTVKPQNLSIYNGAALPTAFTLIYEGLVSGDTITPAGTPEFALKNGSDALANSSTNGTYTIEWTNKADVTVEHSNYDITKADGTLTISTQSSNNGGGSSAPSTPVMPAAPEEPTVPTTTTSGNTATSAAKVEAQVNSNGTAVASVSAASMTSLIESAKSSEKSNKNAVIELKVTAPESARASQVVIPRQSLDTIAKETSANVRIGTTKATLTFDSKAISAISGASASEDIQVSVQTVSSDSLPASAQAQVGSRPVYDFTVTAGSTQVSSFNGGSVGVSIPYTPAAGEDINAIVIYYIGDNGELETVTNGRYNAATGSVDFSVAHFSTYAVGYNKVSFTDVSGSAWYGDAVGFLAARGVTSGTTETTFSPDMTLNRGQFITLLMRAYGIDADNNTADNFIDAGNTYYSGYLAAAKRLGITKGVGDNKFAPEQAITRQEMFTLLYNALKAIKQLPENDSGKNLLDFTDNAKISSYAQEAMGYLVKTGIVGGSNEQLSPTATTTRAQMAQVLYNLIAK